MLPPSDADIIHRDTAIPGLAMLLDNETLVGKLRPFLSGFNIGTLRSTYVRYKPATSCLVAYQLDAAGVEVELYATAYRFDAQDKLEKARRLPCVQGLIGPGRIFFKDLAAVVSLFPNDRKLKTLSLLASARARRSLLCKLFPNRPDFWNGTLQSLRYKPERRYVARLVTEEGPQAVLKMYSNDNYREAYRNVKAFISHSPLRLARRIGRSTRHHILAFEWFPGKLLSQSISETGLSHNDAVKVGAALATLHAQKTCELAYLTRETEAVSILKIAAWISFICPHLTRRVYQLAQRLSAEIVEHPPLNRSIHGDFYGKQVLIGSDTVAILDLDRAVRGDPASDIGNFAAHMELENLFKGLASSQVSALKEAIIEGYEAATHDSIPARIELYTAIGLYRLMPEPFKNREPDWPKQIEAILERAEAILPTLPE